MTTGVVECPKCWKARWHATGGITHNRHGRARAELVCESCGYVFGSIRPEALQAAAGVDAADRALDRKGPALRQGSLGFTKIGELEKKIHARVVDSQYLAALSHRIDGLR